MDNRGQCMGRGHVGHLTDERYRPMLGRGLAVIPTADGLIVEGGFERVSFSGVGAREILPDLLSALRQPCDPSALANALGLPTEDVIETLDKLDLHGLLEWYRGDAARVRRTLSTRDSYYSRLAGYSGRHRTGTDLIETLRRSTVHIRGDAGPVDLLRRLLANAGLGVSSRSEDDRGQHHQVIVELLDPTADGLVSATPADGSVQWWLPVRLSRTIAEIGPMLRQDAMCGVCIGLLWSAGVGTGESVHPVSPPQLAGDLLQELAMGVCVNELVNCLAGTGPTRALGSMIRLEAPASADGIVSIRSDRFIRNIECANCGDGGSGGARSHGAWKYEQVVESPEPTFALPALKRRLPPGRLRSTPVRTFATSPRVTLPRETGSEKNLVILESRST